MRVMGWWANDVFTILATNLTDADVAAQTILRNIGLFAFMIPVGISSSTNYLTGYYIGKNRVDLAKKIANLCIFFAFIWVLTEVIILKIA